MKRVIFATTLAGILLFVHQAGFGQSESTIYGTVVATADGSALPNSTVRIQSSLTSAAISTTSDSEGRFAFMPLIPGPYTIHVSHEDFREQTLDLTLKPREIQNVRIELSLRGISESVKVEAAPEAVESTHSPSSTTLDSRFVDRFPLAQRNNLPDMLAVAAPGMIRSHATSFLANTKQPFSRRSRKSRSPCGRQEDISRRISVRIL